MLSPIQNIPDSWDMIALQKTGEVVYGIQASVANNIEPIGTKTITNKNISLDGKFDFSKVNYFEIQTPKHEKTKLKFGDILFNWRSGSKHHVGKVAYFDLEDEYIHSSFILRIRANPNVVNNKYLYFYLFWLRVSEYFIKLQTYSINAKFNKTAVNYLPTVLPPLEEQKKIAAVLSLVQKAISQQEKAIALTTEIKKALMQKLFTEGTRNETQKMTEIGLIPESWEVKNLSECCDFLSGGTPSKKQSEFWHGNINWVCPRDMKFPRLKKSRNLITEEGLKSGSKLAPQDSILIVVRGMILAKDVPVAIIKDSMAFNQDIKALLPYELILSDYLLYYLQNSKDNLLSKVGTSAHGTKTLLTGEIKDFLISIPSSEEQKIIACFLEKLELKIEFLKKKQIHLTELFQTLLHQLMTAQIRVDDLDLSPLNL